MVLGSRVSRLSRQRRAQRDRHQMGQTAQSDNELHKCWQHATIRPNKEGKE